MEKILISSCLVGYIVRYNAQKIDLKSKLLQKWSREERLIKICPEVSAGLPTPRNSSEIVGGDGVAVLKKQAKVLSKTNEDKTVAFIEGASLALQLVRKHNIKIAIMKKNSPSCGNEAIYDGTFTGNLTKGAGVTSTLLSQHGVKVFNEEQLVEASDYLSLLESI